MNIEHDTSSLGIVSSVSGAMAMVAWLVPVIGGVLAVFSIYTGTQAMNNHEDGWPLAGVALGFTALVLTVLRSGLVYYYG